MHKRIALVAALALLALPAAASAHVQLMPNQVAPGSFTLFTVLSPNENPEPLTGLRLLIPPTLLINAAADTPGFKTKILVDQRHRIAGISWQGGSIAPARLALFQFSGLAGAAGTLHLTGIQSFADGSTRTWHSPVVTVASTGTTGRDSLTLGIAGAALVLALVVALALAAVFVRERRTVS
jgi:hypothetical protein